MPPRLKASAGVEALAGLEGRAQTALARLRALGEG